MRITVKPRPKGALVFDGLAISAVEGDDPGSEFARLDKELGGALSRRAKAEKFEGKSGQTLTITPLEGRHAARIVVAGLGKKSELTAEKIRRAAAGCALALRDSGAKTIAYPLEAGGARALAVEERARAVAEGVTLALYTFDALKSEKEKKKVGELIVLAPDRASARAASLPARTGGIVAESALLARDLINYPANVATPTFLANQAKKMAAQRGVACKVFGPAEIRRMGMGGLMAVAKGSHEPARFIVLEYRKGPKGQKPIVMVGKGLTFDTGGISLKPADKMHEMKSDMSGAAAVIGTARALAELKLPVNFVGLIPATENMPGGSANKPGDVVKSLSGVTMEILNTDAEGRLVLSDALAYAARYKPEVIVDFATLTGACMVALGEHAAGLFTQDEKLAAQLGAAGEATGERVWRLPLWPEHEEDIKGDVADIKNIGPRGGGASTAAAFLKKHVTAGPWAHVDIAGVAYTEKAKGYIRKGGVGVGVRLMVEFIEKRLGL